MKGTKQYRFNDNPTEQLFHDKFIEKFTRDSQAEKTLSGIVNGWDDNKQYRPIEYLTDKEQTICVNLIQWLGSPVGQSFLRECGFENNNK